MDTIRTGSGGAVAVAVILLMSHHALADEAESRKACESLRPHCIRQLSSGLK